MPILIESLLPPWKLVQTWGVGGLLGVGYAPGTDLLLVGSHDGLGVFDVLKGERIAREREAEGYPDESTLLLEGIGLLAGQRIRTAGLHGGGLPLGAGDGIWHLELEPAIYSGDYAPYRGKACWQIRLIDGRSWVGREGRHLKTCLLYQSFDFRATGFSETGKSFIIATSSDLWMFSREEAV
ncbi:hypothetical protein [Armatimonas rosea]|uniref:Uncharacterized protein n=1 Tax=Armatimonas rosea TaxID=685828 RepID=A0A7W9SVH5_ARMRO|nr:hypothetical protein [Armatimonas rosea]MBB6053602.1 hypothetical protein [Armatimonas rosea]